MMMMTIMIIVITVAGMPLEVSISIHFGTKTDTLDGEDTIPRARTGKARTAFPTLNKVWSSQQIGKSTKLSISRVPSQNGVSQAWYIEGSWPEWCISSMIYRGFLTTMVYLKAGYIEGLWPEWCISSMIYRGFLTTMVYLKAGYIEGSWPEWCISSMIYRGFLTTMVYLKHDISKVPDQNGVSQAWYIVEIHHSGQEPSISNIILKTVLLYGSETRRIPTAAIHKLQV